MTTVAIVEDHPVFRHGLQQTIQEDGSLEIVGAYGSLEDFLTQAPTRIDVVLLDLHLPGVGGAEGVQVVHERGHHILVVSASSSPDMVVAAIGAGANGYLTKDAETAEILRALTEISRGGTYVSPTLASHLLTVARHKGPEPLQLSDRERQILALVAAGERDQDIADQLFINVNTVHSHLDRIRDKTGRRRRADLTRLAAEMGLLNHRPIG
jgi:DNA-binding NarL/FixJ family response regulator